MCGLTCAAAEAEQLPTATADEHSELASLLTPANTHI